MKKLPLAILAATLFTAVTGFAQTAVTTTSMTTSDGTISEFSPDTIVIHSQSAPEPVRYSYSKTTTYVDESGAPVSLETVQSGLPVTIHYIKEGDRMVANRVIVHKKVTTAAPAVQVTTTVPAVQETRTTTTTTTTK